MRICLLIWVFIFLIALDGRLTAQTDPSLLPHYRITDLGTLGGRNSWTLSYDWTSRAHGLALASALNNQVLGPAINNQGSIIGYSETSGGRIEPFLWKQGKMRRLSHPHNWLATYLEWSGWHKIPCQLTGINNQEHLFGLAYPKKDKKDRVFLTNGNMFQYLDRFKAFISFIIAFNDNDEIYCNDYVHVMRWHKGKLSIAQGYIGTATSFQGDLFGPSGMNNIGQAVGCNPVEHRAVTDPRWYAVFWSKGRLQKIGVANGYQSSVAYRINDASQVIGINSYLATPDGKQISADKFVTLRQHEQAADVHLAGFVWSAGKMRLLPGLPHNNLTLPDSINNRGDVVGMVGSSYSKFGIAVLWKQGKIYDLNSLVPANLPWYLRDTGGINDSGQIVVTGFSKWGKPHKHLLLLTPIK